MLENWGRANTAVATSDRYSLFNRDIDPGLCQPFLHALSGEVTLKRLCMSSVIASAKDISSILTDQLSNDVTINAYSSFCTSCGT